VPASQIPEVLGALRYARSRGSIVVAASGNEALRVVAYPARAGGVISVGATTEHLCQADYSNDGRGLDIVAPGGGADAAIEEDPQHCRPTGRPGRDIFQLTFAGSVRRFGLPGGYEGTSMAAPHVSAIAALVIASGVVGSSPSATQVEERLEATARDLGPPGPDERYGAGLVDAARATAPNPGLRRRS
jgi:serine protease